MYKVAKILFPCLALAITAASSFGQIVQQGLGKSVKAVYVDTRRFSPQIDARAHTRQFEKDHEMKFTYPFGVKNNNLITGGALSEDRIAIANNAKFPGISATGAEPPDPDIAVGPTHLIEVVNSSIAFYTKGGTKVFEQTFQNFFKSISPQAFDYDPKVIYDQIAKRFVVLDLDLNDASSNGASDLLIAVSATSDPNGAWALYKVDVKQTEGSNTYWWDYPGLGYNKDMICMTGNMFAMEGSSGFNGVQIVCFDKTTLYGGTATPTKFKVADGFTIQLAKTQDATTPAVYGVEVDTQNSMRLTGITKSGSTFAVTQSTVSVPNWLGDQGFITGPGGVQVQTNDPRILVSASRNGEIVASHSVAVSGSDLRSAARWYHFKTNGWPQTSAPSLKQSGQLDPPAGHGYSFPAINFDGAGNIGMTFSKIGSTTPGLVMGTGRRVSDPAGTMGNPTVLESSTAGQYNGFSTRWGDYFDVELDPADSKTFWAVGMGAGQSVSGRWQTYMKSFKIALLDVDLTAIYSKGVTTVAGTLSSGTRASLNTIDGNKLAIRSQSVSGLGEVAGFNSLYTVPFASVDTLRMYLAMNGPVGSSAIISLQNISTGAYDVITTIGMSGTDVTKTIELTADQISKYVSSSGNVSLIVRCVSPTRGGRMPARYVFNCDQASFAGAPKS